MGVGASKRFVGLPPSNGHDRVYEQVKRELRELYGKDADMSELPDSIVKEVEDALA
mgnify:CR=1 FL=1